MNLNRERLELTRPAWGFSLLDSLFWSWLAQSYWRHLHGRAVESREDRPRPLDVPEGSR